MSANLRCTAKLLKAMRARPIDRLDSANNKLGDWTANLVRISRRQFVVAVSEPTRLGIMVDAAPYARLPSNLGGALLEVLIWLGVPAEDAEVEASCLLDARIAATNNRSVLGTVNQFAWDAECMWRYGRATTAQSLTRRLARVVVLSPKHIGCPEDRVREAFGLSALLPEERRQRTYDD
jgi:hypothetical protein